MKVNFIKPISFQYKSVLKTEWLKGNMPEVTKDMEGNLLTKDNCTLGHMLPHSKGGKTRIDNLMLETAPYNFMKGNLPFSQFFNKEGFEAYCEQFKNVNLPDFNGLEYIEKITRTAKRLLRMGK